MKEFNFLFGLTFFISAKLSHAFVIMLNSIPIVFIGFIKLKRVLVDKFIIFRGQKRKFDAIIFFRSHKNNLNVYKFTKNYLLSGF
jgi:hypothetical protein